MSRAGSLFRDLGTLVKRNKIKLCDYTTTEPARLAEAITLSGRPSQWTPFDVQEGGGGFQKSVVYQNFTPPPPPQNNNYMWKL